MLYNSLAVSCELARYLSLTGILRIRKGCKGEYCCWWFKCMDRLNKDSMLKETPIVKYNKTSILNLHLMSMLLLKTDWHDDLIIMTQFAGNEETYRTSTGEHQQLHISGSTPSLQSSYCSMHIRWRIPTYLNESTKERKRW